MLLGESFSPATGFAALGDPTRLALLDRLRDGTPRSIRALAGHTELTRQAVSKHLRVLESAGMVQGVKRGRERQYVFRRGAVRQLRDYLDAVSQQWDGALERLQAQVEESAAETRDVLPE